MHTYRCFLEAVKICIDVATSVCNLAHFLEQILNEILDDEFFPKFFYKIPGLRLLLLLPGDVVGKLYISVWRMHEGAVCFVEKCKIAGKLYKTKFKPWYPYLYPRGIWPWRSTVRSRLGSYVPEQIRKASGSGRSLLPFFMLTPLLFFPYTLARLSV